MLIMMNVGDNGRYSFPVISVKQFVRHLHDLEIVSVSLQVKYIGFLKINPDN